MRSSRARVTVQVRPSKVGRDGYCPVSICVCWQGQRKVVSACYGGKCGKPIKVLYKLWDARRWKVRGNHPNASLINEAISGMVDELEGRIEYLDGTGKSYSVEDCFNFDEEFGVTESDNVYKPLMERYLSELGLRQGTIESHLHAFYKFCEYFPEDKNLETLTDADIRGFCEYLSRRMVDGSVRTVMSRVSAVLNFGREKGVLNLAPFRFKFARVYGNSRRMYCLTADIMQKCFDGLHEVVGDGNDVSYTRKPQALVFFCAMYLLGGIAPIDFSCLTKESVKLVKVDGECYWKVEFHRRKTGIVAKMMLPYDDWRVKVCLGNYIETSVERNGWVYPILTGLGDECNRSVNVFRPCKQRMLEWFRGKGIEVDPVKFSYYTVRHTYASVYSNKPQATLRGLAGVMGRSVTNLDVYIHQLNNDKELLEASSIVL